MSVASDFIKEREGLRLVAYLDTKGVWTIGYGHTGPEVVRGYTISADKAEELLVADMEWAVAAVEKHVKVPLSTNQAAALVSLTFNIGAEGFRTSTCLRKLNAGDYEGASNAMLMWNKVTVDGVKVTDRGLVNRRELERALFMSGTVLEGRPIIEEAPEAPGAIVGGEIKPQIKSKTQWLAGGGTLTSILAAWASLRNDAPELVEWALPYLPYVFALIFAAVMFNRWLDSRNGVH